MTADAALERGKTDCMSITLEFDEQTLAHLPLGPGERAAPVLWRFPSQMSTEF